MTLGPSPEWCFMKPHSIILVTLSLSAALASAQQQPSTDWPCWRGPKADGVADGRSLPIRWSKTENIRWSVKLPGWGTSSPIVHGNRVFVTSHQKVGSKKALLTLCFDRKVPYGLV